MIVLDNSVQLYTISRTASTVHEAVRRAPLFHGLKGVEATE